MNDRSSDKVEYIFTGEGLSAFINTEPETREFTWHIWNASSGQFAKASDDATVRLEADRSDAIMFVVLSWRNPAMWKRFFSQGLNVSAGRHKLDISRGPAQSFLFLVDQQPVAELIFRDSQLNTCRKEVKALWMYRLNGEEIRVPETADADRVQIRECAALTNLSGIARLSKLTVLGLFGCGSLADLEPLRSKDALRSLWLEDCQSIGDLCPLSALKSLNDLSVSGDVLQDQATLKDLTVLAELQSLERLSLKMQLGVAELPSFSRLTALKHFSVFGCRSLRRLPSFPNASPLQTLDGSFCSALEDISGLATATSLVKLLLRDSPKVIDLTPIRGLSRLEEISISGSGWQDQGALKDVSPLADLVRLERLSLTFASGVADLPSFSRLTRLTHLSLTGCRALRQLPAFPEGSPLETLDASSCAALEDISGLTKTTALKKLLLGESTEISDLTPLGGLTHLEDLNLAGSDRVVDIRPLACLTSLRRLCLSGFNKGVSDLIPLGELTQLEELRLNGFDKLADISPLGALASLRRLRLSGFKKGITDLTPLRGLTRLEEIYFTGSDKLVDISPIGLLTSLRRLWLEGLKEITNVTPLGGVVQLEELRLNGCDRLADISPLAHLASLRLLALERCKEVVDLDPLSGLGLIEELYLSGCSKLMDISPIGRLGSVSNKLKRVGLQDCTHIQSLSPLTSCTALRELWMSSRPEDVAVVLACCAVARKDVELIKSSASGWLQEVSVAKGIDHMAVCLAEAFALDAEEDWGREFLAKLVAAMRGRNDGSTDTWRSVLLQCLKTGDSASFGIFASLIDGADPTWISTRFAEPALQALATLPPSAQQWAEEYVARILKMLPESRLREIGTSICLFYAKLGRRDLVRTWLERITNEAAPLWGDRVRGALASAAIEAGALSEGREYLRAMETESQRDLVREKLVLAMAARCPLEAGQVLDEIVDQVRRRCLTKRLAGQDSFVTQRQNLYRLLIEAEEDGEELANLLVQIAVRHPEAGTLSELRRMLVPPREPGLHEMVARVLSNPAVKENVKAKRLVDFQERLARDPMAIERGVVDWLLDRMESEHLITAEERVDIRKAVFLDCGKDASQIRAGTHNE